MFSSCSQRMVWYITCNNYLQMTCDTTVFFHSKFISQSAILLDDITNLKRSRLNENMLKITPFPWILQTNLCCG